MKTTSNLRTVPPVLPLLTLLVAAGSASAQTVSSFHLIGALPGTNTFSSGYGVSEDGSVVVGHSGNNYYYGSSSHAFRWSLDTGIQDLDPLAPAAGAYGVSSDGTIIVGGETSGSVKAVRWGANTSAVTDQLYHGGECYALSRDGLTAVGYSASAGGGGTRPHRAIRYTSSGGHLQFIDTVVAGFTDPTTSESLAVSTDGSVVVGWAVIGGVQRPFRWTGAGMVPLTTASGIANGVSADGSIVVGEFSVGLARHAFRWTASTGMVDLGSLPGMDRSVAYAISADGRTIAGKTQSTTYGGAQRAFIWRADLGMQDANAVLAALKPADHTLTEIRSINSNGTVLAGGSTTPTGGVEAWVVTIPTCLGPSAVTAPAETWANAGANLDLAVTVGGFGPFSYQWSKDGQPIAGATQSHLILAPAQPGDSGSYSCTISSACGSTPTAAAAVTVIQPCSLADIAGGGPNGTLADGTLDGSDFTAFINSFALGNPAIDSLADVAGGGDNGLSPDGSIDGNDFVAFINAFALGC